MIRTDDVLSVRRDVRPSRSLRHGGPRRPSSALWLTLRGVAVAFVVCVGVLVPDGAVRLIPLPPGAQAAPDPPGGGEAGQGGQRTLQALACDTLGKEPLTRIWRGVHPERSGEVLLIPFESNFVNGGLTHATPYDYTQEVPLFMYGPGIVRPGVYDQNVTLADVAPTTAEILKYPFDTADGRPQMKALVPADERPVPALVVTLIWDSVGDNVLERWPESWPFLRSLSTSGAWFENAVVGAAPSNTPVAHASIGTGTFPRTHGLVDVYIRANGQVQEPNEFGPQTLIGSTLADAYDAALGNAPTVGGIGTLSDHLMMMGHGSSIDGGDADIAITREDEGGETTGVESSTWNLTEAMAPYYTLPTYVNDLPGVDAYVDDVDRADGALDGRWRDNDLAQLANGWDSPARSPYQETLVETVIANEGFGDDDVTDLLFLNFKTTDKIGHLFSADGIEMADTLASQDEALGRLIAYLDQEVGSGRYVLILAADHGTQRDPETTGSFMISADKLRAGLAANFDDGDDVPLVTRLRPSQMWLDPLELAESGATPKDIATWMLGLTKADTYVGTTPPSPDEADDPVFAAVLPTTAVDDLPCISANG